MLHALPFTMFGEIAALGFKAKVDCPGCYEHRSIATEHVRDRCFATTRFRRTTIPLTGDMCGCRGSVESLIRTATGNRSITTALIVERTVGATGGSKKGLQSARVYDD
jgi:hypothetical protein